MKKIVYLFAHQDDEYPTLALIEDQINQKSQVYCIYLTNGYFDDSKITIKQRNQESLKVLESIGVNKNNILFVGEKLNVNDGTLFTSLEKTYTEIQKIFTSVKLDKIYCLSWEGGHHDHDASHLLAIALAKNKNILNHTFQYSLYNSHKIPYPLYRVMAPLTKNGAPIIYKLSIISAIKYSLKCWKYTSQIKTWIGLFPEAFIKFVIKRKLVYQNVSIERCLEKPHQKYLFYENKFNISYENFRNNVNAFITKYINQ